MFGNGVSMFVRGCASTRRPPMGLAAGVGVTVAEGLALGLGDFVAFVSAELSGRPCDVDFFLTDFLLLDFFVVGFLVLLPLADGVGDVVGATLVGPSAARTWRNRSSAVWPMVLTTLVPLPGMSTTMLVPPCVVTDAPPTPRPLARCRMMFTAWFRAFLRDGVAVDRAGPSG